MLEWLIRLYPPRWRKRYGDELDQLVRDLRPSVSAAGLVIDLTVGAVRAQAYERLGMESNDRRAIRLGVLVAGLVGLGLATEIYLSNVVFPDPADNDGVSVLVSYLVVFTALFAVGLLAARAGASRRGQLAAGITAGAIIGALTIVSFLVVDNVWLDVVARQSQKIEGFAHSGATSMRAYVNRNLIGPAVFFIGVFGGLGGLLSTAGGMMRRPGPRIAVAEPGRPGGSAQPPRGGIDE